MGVQQVEECTTFTLSSNVFSRPGYVFQYWDGPYGKTYRVGGDEFIIFKTNITPEVLKAGVWEFKLAIDTMHKTTVAIGYSVSKGNLEAAITEAEKFMYKNKVEFYEKNPQLKR